MPPAEPTCSVRLSDFSSGARAGTVNGTNGGRCKFAGTQVPLVAIEKRLYPRSAGQPVRQVTPKVILQKTDLTSVIAFERNTDRFGHFSVRRCIDMARG